MPLYEYICEEDGARLELLRPMADADRLPDDPEGRGRTFKRVHSTFATGGAPGLTIGGGGGGCCPCGKPDGSCGRN
ncbi:MAG: FmdB family zinc ribbon protein [Phycisphaerales bacterium]